ncbi:hypothetical protein FYJ27_11640 [Anaerosalibacter bizertensis]|uniref:Asparagine synthetase domain-containing protein n=1 Tax=Anaerosalibacter bizertensis TaxID=932217 RepID=A0A844FK96_9FIRM|nr:hypothetical protein [Anaerosalibacter bizertensis]MBU5294117.1 hypothetical protein [Anaerosalibacter bizertensis]MSS44352.1 hypothetical protein [Anaerosalibacter bizertensis]
MNFIYHIYNELPKLSWCAILEKDKEDIDIYCGLWVETFDDFFVEGSWDDKFEKGNFNESTFFMGSGAKIDNDKIIFSTPNHTLERLHIIRDNDKIFVSNSLAFVLEAANKKLDIEYIGYEKDFASILKGINDYKSKIPLEDGRYVELYYYCNIVCNNKLNIKKEKKNQRKDFINFDDYYSSLKNCLKMLKENSNCAKRKVRYGVVTTISKGYDSSACAALGKEIGCNTAVTLNRPKKYEKDDGTDIAKMLGYENIIAKNANDYMERTDFIEAEFLSSGELGTGIVFSSFEKEYKKNLVLTGVNGDLFWGRHNELVNREIKYENENIASTTLYENRLRVGYINVPVPFYGALNWPSIYKISNSEEMEKWSIGGKYDKPIPRRILEENGVPRSAFGNTKSGAGFNYQFDNLNRIKKRISSTSFASFCEYYKRNKSLERLLKNNKEVIKYILGTFPIYCNYLFKKLRLNIKMKVNLDHVASNPFAPSYLIHWGIYITRKRYDIKF